MVYVKKQAPKIDEVKPLIERLNAIDHTRRNRIGASKSDSLIGPTGDATFTDPVRLRYWKGGGDCPAGCIHRHRWNITIAPTHDSDGSFAFDVQVTEESGSPLPSR